LPKEDFPTVGPALKKSFHHSLENPFVAPLAKNSSESRGDKLETNIILEPHIARVSRRSLSCHKCKTSLGAFSLQ